MAISQFTLHAKTKKGNRPSYIKAACHEIAIRFTKALSKNCQTLPGKGLLPVNLGL